MYHKLNTFKQYFAENDNPFRDIEPVQNPPRRSSQTIQDEMDTFDKIGHGEYADIVNNWVTGNEVATQPILILGPAGIGKTVGLNNGVHYAARDLGLHKIDINDEGIESQGKFYQQVEQGLQKAGLIKGLAKFPGRLGKNQLAELASKVVLRVAVRGPEMNPAMILGIPVTTMTKSAGGLTGRQDLDKPGLLQAMLKPKSSGDVFISNLNKIVFFMDEFTRFDPAIQNFVMKLFEPVEGYDPSTTIFIGAGNYGAEFENVHLPQDAAVERRYATYYLKHDPEQWVNYAAKQPWGYEPLLDYIRSEFKPNWSEQDLHPLVAQSENAKRLTPEQQIIENDTIYHGKTYAKTSPLVDPATLQKFGTTLVNKGVTPAELIQQGVLADIMRQGPVALPKTWVSSFVEYLQSISETSIPLDVENDEEFKDQVMLQSGKTFTNLLNSVDKMYTEMGLQDVPDNMSSFYSHTSGMLKYIKNDVSKLMGMFDHNSRGACYPDLASKVIEYMLETQAMATIFEQLDMLLVPTTAFSSNPLSTDFGNLSKSSTSLPGGGYVDYDSINLKRGDNDQIEHDSIKHGIDYLYHLSDEQLDQAARHLHTLAVVLMALDQEDRREVVSGSESDSLIPTGKQGEGVPVNQLNQPSGKLGTAEMCETQFLSKLQTKICDRIKAVLDKGEQAVEQSTNNTLNEQQKIFNVYQGLIVENIDRAKKKVTNVAKTLPGNHEQLVTNVVNLLSVLDDMLKCFELEDSSSIVSKNPPSLPF